MKQYFEVYKEFFKTSFSEASSFRVNFLLLFFMDLFFYMTSILSIYFIFDHIEMIGPWNKDQLLFFTAFILTVDHFHMTFLSESFWMLSEDLRLGKLDYVLLKPISSIFIVFFRYVRPASFINFITTWGLLIYFGIQVELKPIDWVLLPFLIILAFALMAVIEFIISTAMFWIIEGFGINFLRMQFQNLARWPDFIYKYVARKVLSFLIPVLLIGSAPVKFLFDKSSWHLLLIMVLALAVCSFVLNKIWRIALNRYESASS